MEPCRGGTRAAGADRAHQNRPTTSCVRIDARVVEDRVLPRGERVSGSPGMGLDLEIRCTLRRVFAGGTPDSRERSARDRAP